MNLFLVIYIRWFPQERLNIMYIKTIFVQHIGRVFHGLEIRLNGRTEIKGNCGFLFENENASKSDSLLPCDFSPPCTASK